MADTRPVFFFDIDNCLYPKSLNVHDLMTVLIDEYFVKHLELTVEDAYKLHMQYYRDYGLALVGLKRNHHLDPMEYNRQVDDALALDEVIKPNPQLRKLLLDIDKSKMKMWLFTNAYLTHGQRVVKLLGIEDLFDGITYCDYAEETIVSKPHLDMFAKAKREAGIENDKDCYFVDDSIINCKQAQALGWNTAHIVELDQDLPKEKVCAHQIRHLEELRTIFPEVFKSG